MPVAGAGEESLFNIFPTTLFNDQFRLGQIMLFSQRPKSLD
jgi:hypothetical protein